MNYKENDLKAFIIWTKKEKDINNYIQNLNKETYVNILLGLENQKIY